jgi:hypothetical protein
LSRNVGNYESTLTYSIIPEIEDLKILNAFKHRTPTEGKMNRFCGRVYADRRLLECDETSSQMSQLSARLQGVTVIFMTDGFIFTETHTKPPRFTSFVSVWNILLSCNQGVEEFEQTAPPIEAQTRSFQTRDNTGSKELAKHCLSK